MGKLQKALKKAESKRRSGEPKDKMTPANHFSPGASQKSESLKKDLTKSIIGRSPIAEKLIDIPNDRIKEEIDGNSIINLRKNAIDKNEIAERLTLLRKKYSKHSFKKREFNKRYLQKREEDLFTLFKPDSVISEHFKVTRTILMSMLKEKGMKTILVTSSLPLEGKSFVASNLALSIASGLDKYVLLVDADLRKPVQQHIFKINSELGLADYLVNEKHQLIDLIQKTPVQKLSLLPAGSGYENSSELLSSELMTLFVQEVKYRYDDRYIIIDSPPAYISEPLALAEKVDYVVLVVKAGKTDKKLVQETVKNIGMHKILGVVLNHCDIKKKAYYGYGYYCEK
jgi:exopolysaccharide/PEP-CTERM locus tyrosine autokinase